MKVKWCLLWIGIVFAGMAYAAVPKFLRVVSPSELGGYNPTTDLTWFGIQQTGCYTFHYDLYQVSGIDPQSSPDCTPSGAASISVAIPTSGGYCFRAGMGVFLNRIGFYSYARSISPTTVNQVNCLSAFSGGQGATVKNLAVWVVGDNQYETLSLQQTGLSATPDAGVTTCVPGWGSSTTPIDCTASALNEAGVK